jgi:hypothetical protein
MAVQFNGSPKNPELEALDLLLKDKSNEYKGRVLEYVRKAKVEADDPTFILMAALGNLDVALVELPKTIEASANKSTGEINQAIVELRTMFQAAGKQAQVQIAAINDAEVRVKKQIDTVSVTMAEATAALKQHRDGSYSVLKSMQESYRQLVDESHTRDRQLLAKVNETGKQLEAERELRLTKPWRNAVNLPPLILVAVIVLPLSLGLIVGTNFTNKESANIDKLRVQIYDTFKKPQEDAARQLLLDEESKKSRKKNKNRG